MQAAGSRIGRRPVELKGGIDPIGHHGGDLDERERMLTRAPRVPQRRARSSFLARCIKERPFTSVGVAAGLGMLLGALLS